MGVCSILVIGTFNVSVAYKNQIANQFAVGEDVPGS